MDLEDGSVRELWPLLSVGDIKKSARFYARVLGFKMVGQAGPGDELFWCRLQRGGASFMLQQREAKHPASNPPAPDVGLYFVCDNVDTLFDEFTREGLSLEPPSTAEYGMRQIFVPDLDGFFVCFESPTDGWTG